TALPPQAAIDNGCLAIRRRFPAACNNEDGADAVFFESLRAERVGDQAATREFANAAGRIASDALPQALIVRVAAVGIGCEPFAYGKASLAAARKSRYRDCLAFPCRPACSGAANIDTQLQQRPPAFPLLYGCAAPPGAILRKHEAFYPDDHDFA